MIVLLRQAPCFKFVTNRPRFLICPNSSTIYCDTDLIDFTPTERLIGPDIGKYLVRQTKDNPRRKLKIF